MARIFRTFAVIVLIALGTPACQKHQTSRAVQAGTVDAEALSVADGDSVGWPVYGHTYGEQRFSPLTGINSENVGGLKLSWYVDLPAGEGGEESTPLVINGVMYVTTSWSRVIALDAARGKVLWRYDPRVPREWGINTCCGVVNRGVAFWQDKVYVGTLDGRLVCLNATNGKPLWEALVIDRAERASITGAPRVIRGRVYIGSAGGEFGVRGRLTAVNAETGAILWRFFTVPDDPSVQVQNSHLVSAERTWSGRWWTHGGGGTVWDSMSYDPALDLLYVGTGNGSPWPRSIRSPEGGDNLYVSSILAIRAETGELAWYYQTTPGDEWGFDAASQMVLTTLDIKGRRRPVLMQAAANGFIYVLDRATGELISATPFVPVNWSKGVDLQTGRPQENPAARYDRLGKPFIIQPGPDGAHSWQPMAFDPLNGLLYIPAMLNTAELSVSTEPQSRYALTSGVRVSDPDGLPPDASRLIAWDPILKRAVWSINRSSPVASGVLASAGSLVFQGSTTGTLEAVSADTGKSLWRFETGTSITAAPITYEANGTQILAVVAGAGGAGLLHGGVVAASQVPETDVPRILAFSLDGKAQLPPPLIERKTRPPERFGTPETLARGKALYARYCARCHGNDTLNAGPLKDLTNSRSIGDPVEWQRIVYAGSLGDTGMPGFFAELNPGQTEDVRAYVVDRAHERVVRGIAGGGWATFPRSSNERRSSSAHRRPITGQCRRMIHMTTQELVQAASHIASGIVAASYAEQQGALSADLVTSIARLSVQVVRRIEELARNPHPERSARL